MMSRLDLAKVLRHVPKLLRIHTHDGQSNNANSCLFLRTMNRVCKCHYSPRRILQQGGVFSNVINGQNCLKLCPAVCAQFLSQREITQSQKEKFTFRNETFRKYLIHLKTEYDLLSEKLQSREITVENRYLGLQAVARKVQELLDKSSESEEIQNLVQSLPDEESDMRLLASEEFNICQQDIEILEKKVLELLTPDRSADHNDIILEVAAGVGGQEAMLFASEMFQMYQNYAKYKGWLFQTVTYETSDIGGLRKAAASVSGTDVYKAMKFEAGVHRVQRVPRTEKAGRVHTSTMTVAVLPQPTEIDVTVNQKDLQIETCRASGKGGQHVNTTDSAVRIVHLPTGIFAECQEERSQIQNKEIAMKVLKSRIYQKFLDEQESQQQAARKFQVGSAGRSEKIRTYNFSQDRITDHRLGQNIHSIEQFISGGEQLDRLIIELSLAARFEILDEIVTKFSKEQNC